MALTKADVIRKAADHLETVGWHQGSYTTEEAPNLTPSLETPCCAAGALWAVSNYARGVELSVELAEYLGLDNRGEQFYTDGLVWVWNDAPERTAEEVITTLRAWADSLEAN